MLDNSQSAIDLAEAQEKIAEALKVPVYTVSDFLAVCNQTLEYSFSTTVIVGEVASFKVNQGRWVFFDLKDEESTVSCFLPAWELRTSLEDGMKVVVKGVPKVTKWGKFSLTVKQVRPMGEGSLKKALEMLRRKLAAEGLFDPARKRELPRDLSRIGVISSTQAAGYADFCKILNARWGGLTVLTAHTQVQGLDAPDQIIRALRYFNERSDVEVIAIIRGGGSADDLAVFNDEKLVREIAASKIPVITGIGHEVDESLADLAADVRASTPSNVAEMLTPDKKAEIKRIERMVSGLSLRIGNEIEACREQAKLKLPDAKIMQVIADMRESIFEWRQRMNNRMSDESRGMRTATTSSRSRLVDFMRREMERRQKDLLAQKKILAVVNPDDTLKKGYAIVSGDLSEGNVVKITTFRKTLEAQIKKVKERRQNA